MSWYKTLKLPKIAPDESFFKVAWIIIFIFATTAALIVWNSPMLLHGEASFAFIVMAFLFNALLNLSWSFLFFKLHFLGFAAIESAALALSTLTLVLLSYNVSVLASILLLPYFAWVCFVIYLNYQIWKIN